MGEWGVWRNGDNPDYVRRMFEQFRANAGHLYQLTEVLT